MSARPNFLTSPGSWVRTARISQSSADYASPVTRYRHEHTWRASDVVMAVFAIAAILVVCFLPQWLPGAGQ